MTKKSSTQQQADACCFFISPIGEPETEERTRSDKVMRHILLPVADEFGYKPLRGDQIDEPGHITTQVLQHLLEDDVVIADLTGHNPNVFYELAARHATGKATIHLIDAHYRIPFDVAGMRTIKYDLGDLDNVADCKAQLHNQFQSIRKGETTENPLSQTITIQQMQRSGSPVQQSLADITRSVGDLSTELQAIRRSISLVVSMQGTRPDLSIFSGSGTGVYAHGLFQVPDFVLLQPLGKGVVTYDKVGPRTVEVTCHDGASGFIGVAIKDSHMVSLESVERGVDVAWPLRWRTYPTVTDFVYQLSGRTARKRATEHSEFSEDGLATDSPQAEA